MSKDDENQDHISSMGSEQSLKHRWFLIWDRSDQNLYNQQHNPKEYFLFETFGFISYREFIKRVDETTKRRVDEITYQRSDNDFVVITNDESLDYVKELEHKRIEGGADVCEINLTIRPAGAVQVFANNFVNFVKLYLVKYFFYISIKAVVLYLIYGY